MAGWVAIQRNPRSGPGDRPKPVRDLVRCLEDHGVAGRVFTDRDELDAAVQAEPELLGIVAAGGDGTLLDVVNRHPEQPVAILPLGSENLVSRYLRIPCNGRFVADMISAGQRRRFDLGQCGDRAFTVMAGVGLDAEIVRRTHAARTGHVSRISYLYHSILSLASFRYPEVQVFLDDDPTPLVGQFVLVANLPMYALGLRIAMEAVEDDGWLDVCILKRATSASMLWDFALAKWGHLSRSENFIQRRARKVKLESTEPVPVQVDGDPAQSTPVEITIHPAACELFVPGT